MLNTRRIVFVISVIGVSATLIALVEGAWVVALVTYAVCVAGLGLLLKRAVAMQRAARTVVTSPSNVASDPHLPPHPVTPSGIQTSKPEQRALAEAAKVSNSA
jgi:hypothetical protein